MRAHFLPFGSPKSGYFYSRLIEMPAGYSHRKRSVGGQALEAPSRWIDTKDKSEHWTVMEAQMVMMEDCGAEWLVIYHQYG